MPQFRPALSKDLLTSKTFWGVIIAVIGWLLSSFGYDVQITPEQTAEYTATIIGYFGNALEGIGLLWATWGRIAAKGPIETIAGVSVDGDPE